jgi:hypothetical protein
VRVFRGTYPFDKLAMDTACLGRRSNHQAESHGSYADAQLQLKAVSTWPILGESLIGADDQGDQNPRGRHHRPDHVDETFTQEDPPAVPSLLLLGFLLVPPIADPVGAIEVGEQQDVEQLGAGSGAEGVQALPESAL